MKISHGSSPTTIIEMRTEEMFDNIQTNPHLLIEREEIERVTYTLVVGRAKEIRRLFEEDGLFEELVGPIALAQIGDSRYIHIVVTNQREESFTITLLQDTNATHSKN